MEQCSRRIGCFSCSRGRRNRRSGLKTYGVLTRNQETATPGDCFSQDITDAVEKGETYKFSFWAKLSDDYKDAPEEQRNVEFAPFYVSGGEATYLGKLFSRYFVRRLYKDIKSWRMDKI